MKKLSNTEAELKKTVAYKKSVLFNVVLFHYSTYTVLMLHYFMLHYFDIVLLFDVALLSYCTV